MLSMFKYTIFLAFYPFFSTGFIFKEITKVDRQAVLEEHGLVKRAIIRPVIPATQNAARGSQSPIIIYILKMGL